MDLKVIKTYEPLFKTDKRYVLLFGGRGGGRSYAASQKALLDTKHSEYSRIAAMRYILGDVRSSIWQEIKDRIGENEFPEVTSDQAMRYELGGNSIDGKGFKKSSSQNVSKLKSLANYSTVIIEEADEVPEEDFLNLDASIRTQKGKNQIILLFNMPDVNHWIIKRWFNLEEADVEGYFNAVPKDLDDTEYVFATYHDNIKNLTPSSVNTFKLFKDTNPEYYYTMIKGLVSEGKKGRVFKNWKPMTQQEYNNLPYPEYYGLDFGFSNDPSALVGIRWHNNKLYIHEYLYRRGLTNFDLADELKAMEITSRVVADSAEPKSIEELQRLGVATTASEKGPDSIRAGIDLLNGLEVHYTESSENIKYEIANYVYLLDKGKEPTNKPKDRDNHAMDAIRYVASHHLKRPEVKLTFV